MEVLRTKHLDARPPSAASLDTYLDCEHHQQHSDKCGGTTLRRGRAVSGKLSEPPELAPTFCSGERLVAADCRRLRGVVRQQANFLTRQRGSSILNNLEFLERGGETPTREKLDSFGKYHLFIRSYYVKK